MVAVLSLRTVIIFSFGFLCGFLFTTLFERSGSMNMISSVRRAQFVDYDKVSEVEPLSTSSKTSHITVNENTWKSTTSSQQTTNSTNTLSSTGGCYDIQNGSTLVADDLYKSVRVLCFILTTPENHRNKADHVLRTWARRCNKAIFVTDEADIELQAETLVIENATGRNGLIKKTAGAFEHIYRHFLTQFDWFLKADDDTYIIMENLRYFLSHQNTSKPVYFGHWFRFGVKQGYYSGGAGYVLGQEAIRRWGVNRISHSKCFGSQWESAAPDQNPEDLLLGFCMEALGVQTASTLDSLGRTRFHSFNPQMHLMGGYPDWYIETHDKYEGTKKGQEWISEYAISFHYLSSSDLYMLDFFVNHLRAYGRIAGLKQLN